jgi:hypothetical protein
VLTLCVEGDNGPVPKDHEEGAVESSNTSGGGGGGGGGGGSGGGGGKQLTSCMGHECARDRKCCFSSRMPQASWCGAAFVQ